MFQIGETKDAEYVDAVKQNILDGSSKWFAKIAITGKFLPVHAHKLRPSRVNYSLLLIPFPVITLHDYFIFFISVLSAQNLIAKDKAGVYSSLFLKFSCRPSFMSTL